MNNECLICFEECDEYVPCCKKNIHIKCLNSFWQYNKQRFNICPHCNTQITTQSINIDIESGTVNNNINNNINNNDKKCLLISCSSLMLVLFLISIKSYIS
jgi:hypothetical protein